MNIVFRLNFGILREMNRHYTRRDYLRIVERLRGTVDRVGLSTDLIVGFPGETDKDFEATLELVSEVDYDSFYSFEYSPRRFRTVIRSLRK